MHREDCASSVDPDQTALKSSLIWVYAVCHSITICGISSCTEINLFVKDFTDLNKSHGKEVLSGKKVCFSITQIYI